MDNVSLTLGISNLLSGLLILGMLWPLYLGKVGRNHLYGMRTRKTLSSDEIWFPVNKYAARKTLPWAAMLMGLGAASFLIPLKSYPSLAIFVGLAPLCVIIPCIQSARYCAKFEPRSSGPDSRKRKRRRQPS